MMAEIMKDGNEWRVEFIHDEDDGAIEVAIFAGPDAEGRATNLLAHYYGNDVKTLAAKLAAAHREARIKAGEDDQP